MVQNHLMEAMALVLMEQPARMDAGSFRAVRVEGLRAVATPAAQTMPSQSVRGRYTAGTIGTRQVLSCVDEPGAGLSRNTGTYASLALQVNSPGGTGSRSPCVRARPWRRTRPRSPSTSAPASTSGPASNRMFAQWAWPSPACGCPPRSTAPNAPPRSQQLQARPAPPRFTACAHLILQMLNSDPMLFIRGDEAEEAWRIIDPVMKAWSAAGVPLQEYPAGQEPPGPPS
jgi:glucose-6-phosphate 1-dehydrogenase